MGFLEETTVMSFMSIISNAAHAQRGDISPTDQDKS